MNEFKWAAVFCAIALVVAGGWRTIHVNRCIAKTQASYLAHQGVGAALSVHRQLLDNSLLEKYILDKDDMCYWASPIGSAKIFTGNTER